MTVIPAMENPKRAWHLRSHGFTFDIYHHRRYDAVDWVGIGDKAKWLTTKIRKNFHAGRLYYDSCMHRSLERSSNAHKF